MEAASDPADCYGKWKVTYKPKSIAIILRGIKRNIFKNLLYIILTCEKIKSINLTRVVNTKIYANIFSMSL